MNDRFIKFLPSRDALDLARKHPKAFILLMYIACRARRYDDPFNGLLINECKIGDWENMGLSRQEYRSALNLLIFKKFLEKTETNRNRKKSTTGSTTEGTKVKLLNSDIWDINSESANHWINHCPTTDQPLTNHVKEYKERKKNVKNKNIKELSEPIESQKLASPLSTEIYFSFETSEFKNISEKDLSVWKAIYPSVDLQKELLEMREWLLANPSKAKTKKLFRKFIINWLKRSQDTLSNREAYVSRNKKDDSRAIMNGKRQTEYDNAWRAS